MSFKKTRVVLAAAVLTAVAAFSPSTCQAQLFNCFSKPAAPAPMTYAPPYQVSMPTCDPCVQTAAPQMNYVPEVKYRWKYARIERTEYQPVAAADPCSGCPVTSYRPITKKSFLPWLHREAYTTYKAVPYGGATPVSYMQPTSCNPCATSCNPCGSTCSPYGGSGMAAPSLNSGCSSCVSATTAYPDNAATDPGYSSPQTTFQSGGTDWQGVESPSSETRLKPKADPATQQPADQGTDRPTAMPRMEIPSLDQDRTARSNRVRTVSYDEPALLNMSGNLYQAATVVVPLRLVPVE